MEFDGVDLLVGFSMLQEQKKKHAIDKDLVRTLLLAGLHLDQPSEFFKACNEVGILDIVCPPLFDCIGIEQDPNYHAEPVYEHLLRTIDECAKITSDPMIRLAALLHDAGKADTRKIVNS